MGRVDPDETRERALSLLRVDCFAGNGEALVCFYESCGFTRTDTFTVGEWPGQVLQQRIDLAASVD